MILTTIEGLDSEVKNSYIYCTLNKKYKKDFLDQCHLFIHLIYKENMPADSIKRIIDRKFFSKIEKLLIDLGHIHII